MEISISKNKAFFARVLSGSLMIAGTAIGAGMLGIPLVTFDSGFWMAALMSTLVWGFMYLTGRLFLEVSLAMPAGSNLLTITSSILGAKWKWFAGGMFLFLYYCLMVAYFAAGGTIIASLTGLQGIWAFALFGALFGLIVGIGPKSIDRANLFLWIGKAIVYVGLIAVGSSVIELPLLNQGSPRAAYMAIPVLFSAFGYHNVIPSLCTYFNKDRKALRLSLLCGTLLSLVVYLLWIWVVLGSVPVDKLRATLELGKPATEALVSIAHNPWIFRFGQWFGVIALSTSVLGVAFSMVDFLRDGLGGKGPRWILTLLTFLPPMAFALYDPTVFDKALGIAGGFGEAFLNGLLPIMLAWSWRKKRGGDQIQELKGGNCLLAILFVLGSTVCVIEILHLLT